MPRTKAKLPEKHVAVVHAEVAQERITAQKPKPKFKFRTFDRG